MYQVTPKQRNHATVAYTTYAAKTMTTAKQTELYNPI